MGSKLRHLTVSQNTLCDDVIQEGVASEEAAKIAADAGLGVVQDRCVFVETARRR